MVLIGRCKIIWMHCIVKNIAVNTACIHQVQKCAQISSNILFSIKMISCSTLINYVNSIHSFDVHFDNICASYLDFWRWSFLLVGTVDFFCYSFSITEQYCYWTLFQPLVESYFLEYKSKSPLFIFQSTDISTILFYLFGQC